MNVQLYTYAELDVREYNGTFYYVSHLLFWSVSRKSVIRIVEKYHFENIYKIKFEWNWSNLNC